MRILIILLTLVMTFKPVLPLADYVINYDYISEVLCINKSKPELSCNGKCHLKSELAKASEDSSSSDSENTMTAKRLLQVEFLENNSFNVVFQVYDTQLGLANYNFHQNYNYLYSKSIFHPPLV